MLGPVVVDEYGSTVRLRGARELQAGRTAALWIPAGRPRLELYVTGRYFDGWLADAGTLRVWPDAAGRPLSGRIAMRLTAPSDEGGATTVTFELPGRRVRVRLPAGTSRRVSLPVCANGAWRAGYRSSSTRIVGLRVVSLRASTPVFTPDATACAGPARVALPSQPGDRPRPGSGR